VEELALADVSTAGHVVNAAGFDELLPLERLALLATSAVGHTVPDDAHEVVVGIEVFCIDECLMLERLLVIIAVARAASAGFCVDVAINVGTMNCSVGAVWLPVAALITVGLVDGDAIVV
jgi:hypothetical protein